MNIFMIGQKGIPAVGGGIEAHVENLAAGLVDLDNSNNIVVYTRPNYTDKNLKSFKNVALISLPSITSKYFDAVSHTFLACLDLFKRRKEVDIVHFHGIGPASLMWLVKILNPSAKIVFTFHCRDYFHEKWGYFSRLYLKLGEFIGCRMADVVIVISRGLQEYVKSVYDINAAYIPNGVDLNIKIDKPVNARYNLQDGEYILSASRLVRHKNVHQLIQAFKEIKTDKKLVIAGGSAYTEKYIDELNDLAKDDSRIVFVGNQEKENLAGLYNGALVFVQPSSSEGLSIALLEAMSYSKIILSSDIEQNREALGDIGILFSVNNVGDLKDKLEKIIEDPGSFDAFCKNGRKRVGREYSLEAISRLTNSYYLKLVK